MCTVYIIYSLLKDRFYIGYTEVQVEERLRKHNSNHKGYTGKTNDWKIIYIEKFQNKKDAMNREKEIKGWKNRKKIQMLISSEHPD